MAEGKKAYSVSEINRYIKNMMASDFALNHIAIKGEISNCKYHSSGHIYFTLKDSQSQIACVMFSGQREGLSFRLGEGQSVVVLGNISVYERDGKYQLYANEILLDGLGALYERFEQLKNRLSDEGIFAEQYKKPIPFYAKKIGIVTAKTGAAIHDIINVASRRNPYAQLYLYPAKVQGEGAQDTIVKGLKVLDQMGMDVLIVGRGGGSLEDLWAFNEEKVARAIFECATPVISAVGHEIDVTIADFAADLRAPTPSAAAELAVCRIQDVFYRIQEAQMYFGRFMKQKLEKEKSAWEKFSYRLEKQSPKNRIQDKRQYLMDMENHLRSGMKESMNQNKQRLTILVERMKGLSPLDKLNKGYAFVTNEEAYMVKKIGQVTKEERLKIAVTDGEIIAKVEKTVPRRWS